MTHFAVAPLGQAARVSLATLVVAPAVVTGGALALAPGIEALAPWVIAASVVVLMSVLVMFSRRRQVALDADGLVVKAAFYTQRIPVASLDLEKSRVVDLEERVELRPTLRTNGMSVPGFHCGHYRLRDLRKAFCMLTAKKPVLVLAERSGRLILLSIERPKALLDALRATRA